MKRRILNFLWWIGVKKMVYFDVADCAPNIGAEEFTYMVPITGRDEEVDRELLT